MQEYIRIDNFGAIRHIEIPDIRHLLILIGESGSGKSTILKVLSMCRWIYKQQNIRCYLHDAGVSRSPFSHSINTYLNSTGILDFVKTNTNILYKRDGVEICIVGKYDGKGASMTVTEPEKEQLCLEKVCFITEKRNTLPDLLSNRTSEKNVGFYVRQLFEDFKVAKEHINELNLKSVDVRLKLEKKNGNEMWMIEGGDENSTPYSIHLEDASSGIQSSAPLEMLLEYYTQFYDVNSSMNNAVLKYLANTDALKYFRPSLNVGEIQNKNIDIHIEEPEMCLFPTNQVKLLNRLIAVTMMEKREYTIRTGITTHSPYLLNYLNLMFKAYDKGVYVNDVNLNFDDVNVYAVVEGQLQDLKSKNAHLIDPAYLSSPIDEIYNKYDELDGITENISD